MQLTGRFTGRSSIDEATFATVTVLLMFFSTWRRHLLLVLVMGFVFNRLLAMVGFGGDTHTLLARERTDSDDSRISLLRFEAHCSVIRSGNLTAEIKCIIAL